MNSPRSMALFPARMPSKSPARAAAVRAMLVETLGRLDQVTMMSRSYDDADLINGRADAVAAYLSNEPFHLKQKGLAVNIIDPRSYGIDFYGDNLITTEREIQGHPERVAKVPQDLLALNKRAAHRAMESITMDREVMHERDRLSPRIAELIYNGFWFSPEREALQQFMDEIQKPVNGEARITLYKGNVIVDGRRSDSHSLYDEATVTFEADDVYDQGDATGFIRLQSLRLRTFAEKRLGEGE